MLTINNKFDYVKLTRLKTDEGRKYSLGSDGTPVPSVTTILDKTGDKTHLIEWRKRIGEENAKRESREAAGLGTTLHNAIENYILGRDYEIKGNNLSKVIARRMFDVMLEKGFPSIDEIWGTEIGLIADNVYAGTADLIGVYDGVESIMDFKNSKRIKKREWITDYFLQSVAYAEAHNEMYGTNIKQAVIMMVDREGKYKSFILEGDEFEAHRVLWMQRVAKYYGIQL